MSHKAFIRICPTADVSKEKVCFKAHSYTNTLTKRRSRSSLTACISGNPIKVYWEQLTMKVSHALSQPSTLGQSCVEANITNSCPFFKMKRLLLLRIHITSLIFSSLGSLFFILFLFLFLLELLVKPGKSITKCDCQCLHLANLIIVTISQHIFWTGTVFFFLVNQQKEARWFIISVSSKPADMPWSTGKSGSLSFLF